MMKILRSMLPNLIVLASLVFSAGPVVADHFFRQVTHTDSLQMMGRTQPERYDTMDVWMSDHLVYASSAKGNILLDSKAHKIFLIDHASKTYVEIPLSEISSELKGGLQAVDSGMSDSAGPRGMLKGQTDSTKPLFSVKVTPTDETRQIGEWPARKYTVETTLPMAGKVTSEDWVTESIHIDYSMYYKATMAMLAGIPGFEEAMAEMKKVKGLTVLSNNTVSMMGMTMSASTRLIAHEEKPAPEGIYAVPSGYTRKEMPKGQFGFGK